MTPGEIKRILNSIESELPVSEWEHEGVPVWPVFRIWFIFAHDEFSRISAADAPPGRLASIAKVLARLGRGVANFVDAAARDRSHNAQIAPSDVVFFTHTTCRVFQVQGRWYDQFVEPIAELLDERGYRSLLLEHAPSDEYRAPRSRSSRYVQPALSAISLRHNAARTSSLPVAGERELAAYFAEHHPDFDLGFEELRRRVGAIRAYARYFARMLARVRPKLAFVVNYYDLPAMAFNLACRERGISTVDIQHGLQGDLHLAYSNWLNVPAHGYALLPTMFWCWSEQDAAAIRAWSEPVARFHRPVVAGNLILGAFMRDDDRLVRFFDGAVRAKAGATNILVTLRPRGGVPALVRAAIEASPASWTWWIRLHPAMRAERPEVEAALASVQSRVVLDEATQLPLYALLRHMDAHLTEISSTVLEADQFGVPSVLCHPTGVEYFAPLVREGSAIGAFTATEIVDALRIQCGKDLPRIQVATIDRDRLARLVEGAS